MEEAWQVKCSSGWPAPGALPPLPSVAMGSSNQITLNAQQFVHPIVHVKDLQNNPQEPFLSHPLTIDFGKSHNSDTSNSFLALLSGNSHGEFQHLPNSRTELAKLHFTDSFGLSTNQTFSATSISSLSKSHGIDSILNGEPSSFITSRPLLANRFQTSAVQKDLQVLDSYSHLMGHDKAVCRYPYQGINTSLGGASNRSCSSPLNSSKIAINYQNKQTALKDPLDANNFHGLIPSSLFPRGHPRVLCMNTAGEIFVNDMGLLGILCSCHGLPMSLAKFCLHSGLSTLNPGEDIRMENGMPLAKWWTMFSRTLIPGDSRGLDHSKPSLKECGYIGHKDSSFSLLSKNHGTMNSVEPFVGLGRSEELWKHSLHAHHPNLVEPCSLEKSVNIDIDSSCERGKSDANDLKLSRIPGLAQAGMPAENCKVKALKGNPKFVNTDGEDSTSNRQEQNIVSQLASNINNRVISGNVSVSYAHLGPKNIFSQDKNIPAQTNSSTEAFTVHSAGPELRLGQPSQHKLFSSLFATGMHSQFQASSPNVALQKVLSDRTEFHGETKRTKRNQHYPFPEAPSLDRRRLVVDGETATSLPNAEFDLSTYASKDSSISLFLSHLTGETDIADSSDKLRDGMFYFTSSHHVDVPSAQESLAVCTRNEMNEIEKQPTLNGVDYGNGDGHASTIFSDNYISMGGTNEIHVKPIEENGVFTPLSSVQYLNSSLVDMGNSSSILDQPFRVLNEHKSNNLNTHGNVTFHDDKKLDSKMIHGSMSRLSHWNDPSSCLYSESSMNRSSTSCSCTTEKKCFFKHSSDGNMGHLTCGWHKSLIAKPEQLNSLFAMKPQLGKFCCLSAMEQPRSSCQDGSAHNDGDCCSIHRNTSDLHSSSNRLYNNVLLCKSGCAASYKYCSCTSPQSSEPRPVFTCHVCGTDHNHCFRLRKSLDDTAENVGPKMCMHMGVSLPFSSKCCCGVISNCLTGHCFNGTFNNVHTDEETTFRDRSKYLNSTCDIDAAFQEGRMVGIGQCTCFKKALAMKKNCQTCSWKDVSGKAMGCSTGTTDKQPKVSETIIVDKPALSVSKELNATFKASTSGEEHQMSNLSSRSSAPAVTDASVEVNKRDLQLSIVDNRKVLQYPEQDEGSGIEKCSSSIEVPRTTECKEVPDISCEWVPCKSGPCWMSSHSSGRSCEQKKVMGKFSAECTIQGNNCHRRHLASMWQLGNTEDSSKQEYLNVMDRNGYSLVTCSNPPNFMDQSKCLNPSSKIAGVAMQPEGVVEGCSSTKRKRFVFPSKFISLKKLEKYHNTKGSADKHCIEEEKLSVSKGEKLDVSLNWKRSAHPSLSHRVGERPPKYMSLSCISDYKHNDAEGPLMRRKPVVCGNSGIISSGGLDDSQKLARMVPLNLILKRATRCRSNWETDAGVYEFTEKGKECAEVKNEHNSGLCNLQDGPQNPRLDRKNEANSGKLLRLDLENYLSKIGFREAITCTRSDSMISVKNSVENMDDTFKKWKINKKRFEPFPSDVDELCCVCRLSNKEQTNCLLECNRCNIKVHQACYGISKVPKGLWYCRPCKTNVRNIACVLCGYEGGAMTRALDSGTIVRSLLKAWNVTFDSNSRTLFHSYQDDQVLKPSSSGVDEAGCKFGFLPSEDLRSSKSNIEVDVTVNEYKQTSNLQDSNLVKNRVVHNTITEGVFEPSTIQWVHVVCGLWTPGTRCPNVNTMSAFDVSGASPGGKNIVCSICNRPGGTCIKCRVANCSIHFHPWCAHQKGLLQSEIEGDENEKVGFYGSCRIHAANNYVADDQPLNVDELPRSHEASVHSSTCARVEEFKGRKNERGFNQPQNDEDGCIVSQVQINAWLHINGQKSCIRGALKPTCSDVEHDHRKEYIRYKLSKAWKHLVVYKSGIHALGLYTSQFIARGAMVVEYVGEIVGLRVADKRETEYQSGGRLQCKSACYFFRIDKEHIVDATRKGGIARFVNHSCVPNCVAKIISIRNDKKVVFSAERDIFPGEEITYDYHFNREDEGKRIPCLCKSKNCRRYLN